MGEGKIAVSWVEFDGAVTYRVVATLPGATKEEVLEQIREALKLAPDPVEGAWTATTTLRKKDEGG